MKKSELEALKKAYDIPPPKDKKLFISSCEERLKNKRTFPVPMILRYTAVAVTAALVVGVWGSLKRVSQFSEKFTESSQVIEIETTTEAVTEPVTDDYSPPPTENISVTTTTVPDNGTQAPVVTATQAVGNAETSQHTTANTTSSDTNTTACITATQTTGITTVTASATAVHTPVTSPVTTTQEKLPIQTTVTAATTTTEYAVEETIRTTATTTKSISEVLPEPVTTVPDNFEPTEPSTETPTTDDDNVTDSTAGNDYTVTPSVVYGSDGNIYTAVNESESAPIYPGDELWKDMADSSDIIVYGSIEEIIYTSVDGMPYTQYNIRLYDIFKGNDSYSYFDIISVYLPGGYMPADVYRQYNYLPDNVPDDYTVFDSGGNSREHDVYESFIFFLCGDNLSVPEGAFTLTYTTDISMFEYSSGKYISLGDQSITFTASALDDYL